MKKKIVTFGEIMLRLTTPDNLRIQQSRDFLVNYGGSEANVAISVANFGGEVEFITRLPENALGDTCLAELRSHNIGTQHVLIGGKRLGTYYMEKAAAMRNSKVIYDRDNSAFSELKPGMIDWHDAFKDASIFHWSGIAAALTPGLADVCNDGSGRGIRTADRMPGSDMEVEVYDRELLGPVAHKSHGLGCDDVYPAECGRCKSREGVRIKGGRVPGRNGGIRADAFEHAFGGIYPAPEQAV